MRAARAWCSFERQFGEEKTPRERSISGQNQKADQLKC
jgi:hypothetical protein